MAAPPAVGGNSRSRSLWHKAGVRALGLLFMNCLLHFPHAPQEKVLIQAHTPHSTPGSLDKGHLDIKWQSGVEPAIKPFC